MQDEATNHILREVIAVIPKGTNVYLMGGAVRNAVYHSLFGKPMRQRDYDMIVLGDSAAFIRNIRAIGFVYGKIRRKHQVVLKKKKIARPQTLGDYVFFDMHIDGSEKTPRESLKKHANFTANGFALPLNAVISNSWKKKVIALPTAFDDLKKKILKVNKSEYPADLFAAIRFMSQGFKQPSGSDIALLLQSLKKIQRHRHRKNIKKLFEYVGGEKNARGLLKKLKLKTDVFAFDSIKKL